MSIADARWNSCLLFALVGGCYGGSGADGPGLGDGGGGTGGADTTAGTSPEGDSEPGGGSSGDDGGQSSDDPPGGAPGAGLLECPTIPAPAYVAAQVSSDGPSVAFRSTCAGCHGASGEGATDTPPLPGALTAEQYAAVVRAGRHTAVELGNQKMPAFDASFISDEALAHDYAWLTGQSAGGLDEPPAREDAADWTAAEVDEAFERGLAAFREPDAHGAACANCHAPDGLDLAVLGYDDPTLMRRGLQHISPERARDVVDLIHAQRIRHDITHPCDPVQWRPFQPGGAPLTPAEDVLSAGGKLGHAQDVAFGRYLQEQGLIVAAGVIDSVDDARAAVAEMIELPLRSTRLGMELPRWTSDHHRGEEFRTINDWIPELPSIPNDASQWYALHDAYIEDPTFANLEAIRGSASDMTHHGDYHEVSQWGSDWLPGQMRLKMSSLLVAQHLFRVELLGHEEGWHERGPIALESSPVFYSGQNALGVGCANNEECHANYHHQLPPDVLQELEPDEDIRDMLSQLNHPWFSLGQLFDQGLLESGGFGHNITEAVYWQAKFGHNGHNIHQTYFNAHRVIVQTMWPTELGDTGMIPYHRGSGDAPSFPLFLHGEWLRLRLGRVGPDDPRFEYATRLNINTINMFAYIMRDELRGGAAVEGPDDLHDMIGQWRGVAESFVEHRDEIAEVAGLAPDLEYIAGSATLDLLAEVDALVDEAPLGDYANP